jgi:hypothetical protein
MSHTDRELDDLLGAANPIDEGRLPMPSESPSAQLLYEKITGTPYGGSVRRARRRWTGPGLAALLAVAGGGAVAAYAISSHVTTHLAVTCYVAPTLQSHRLVVQAEPAGPVATCASAWADGRVGTGPVPLLVACATAQGVAAVFPSALGADVCGQLGLPAMPAGAASLSSTTPPTAPPDAAGTLPAAVRDAIVDDLRSTCASSAQAELAITKLLAKANVKWTVVTPTPFLAGRPCASPGFDEVGKRVQLTGIPPISAP